PTRRSSDLDSCAHGAAPRSLADDGHAPALQHGSVRAEHPEEEVEGNSRPAAPTATFELHCASPASRCGQRRDRNEIRARADTIGRINGPGDGEGGVRGGIVDADLDPG